jgi:Chromosome segregation ATPases
METVMSNKVRDTLGKFAPKSETPRKIRSVNLTDEAWQWLATVAEKAEMSRNDYLEVLAESNNPFMGTVSPQAQPFMKAVDTEKEVDDVNLEKQRDTELYPFIETVLTEVESLKLELEAVRAENQLLQIETPNLQTEREELAQLKKQVKESATEMHREERSIELEKVSGQRELSDSRAELTDAKAIELGNLQVENEALKKEVQKLLSALELPEPSDLLNQLKAKRKKTTASLADIEAILEILEES